MRGRGRCALATAVVVGVGALVTAPPSGVVRACECALMSTVEMLSEQTAVVGGEVVGQWEDQSSTDGDFLVWRFRVDERWRGDTPEVIELQATAYGSSCGDPPTDLDGILLLSYQYPNGRYSVDPGCGPDVVSRDLVTYYFESPTPVTGRGPPAAVVAAEALGHNLVVVDAMGAPLRYLPGDGSTVAVAACPGGNNVVQLRAPSYPADIEQPVELVVWDTSEWVAGEPIEVMSAFASYSPPFVACLSADGSKVRIRTDEYGPGIVDVDSIAVTETPLDRASPDPVLFTDPDSGISFAQLDGFFRVVAPGQEVTSAASLVFTVDGSSQPGQFSSGLVGPDGVHLVSTWSGDYIEWLAADARIEPTQSVPRTGPVRAIGALLPGSVPEIEPGVTPPPMFERSGSTVEATPTTTSPTVTASVPVGSTAAPDVTTRVAASGGDGGRTWWPWAGVGILVLAGVAAGVLLPGRR